MAVPKKKLKEVVYKGKQKGRHVAAVLDVTAGSNLFEIEISPLPFKREVRCRLEVLFTEEVVKFSKSCFVGANVDGTCTAVVVVNENKRCAADGQAGCVVRNCFGNTHFVCRIPKPSVTRGNSAKYRNVSLWYGMYRPQ